MYIVINEVITLNLMKRKGYMTQTSLPNFIGARLMGKNLLNDQGTIIVLI